MKSKTKIQKKIFLNARDKSFIIHIIKKINKINKIVYFIKSLLKVSLSFFVGGKVGRI